MSWESERTKRQLELLAAQFVNDSNFLAWVLYTYQKQERLSEEKFLNHLNIHKTQYARLALCRRPDPDLADFAQQAHQIAEYVGIDLDILTRIIREVDSLAAMQNLPDAEAQGYEDKGTILNRTPGLLFAARDRSESEPSGNKQPDTSDEDQQPGEHDVDKQ